MKILAVDDNKTLLKLIKLKLTKSLKVEVDTATTLAEAKEKVENNEYFVTLLDINLPDAPDGEIVDYMVERKIPSIVLSANANQGFRDLMLKKDIIDYIVKESIEDIKLITDLINRLIKNKTHSVLVVEDSFVTRNLIVKLLKHLNFNVFTATNGEEALEILEQDKEKNIKIVLTDYNMPVMDGLTLTRKIRRQYSKNDLSVFVVSSSSESDIIALFLKSGANDFLHKPFSKEEFYCRINNAIEAIENIETIRNNARRDYLTGIYNRRYFFELANEYIEQVKQANEPFAIAMFDIDNFKKINDTYGHNVGDKAIIALANILTSFTHSKDIVARFGGEEFCVILKNVDKEKAYEICERIRKKIEENQIDAITQKISYTTSIGLATNFNGNLNEMINKSDEALYEAKNSGKNQVVIY